MLSFLADSSLDASRSTGVVVPNLFLIFRLVFFALLSNLAFLQLIFASWNINVSLSMTHSAPSPSIFIVFESSMLFISLTFVLADFLWCRGRKSVILLECGWIGMMSLFQIGTAIGTTITGPSVACNTSLGWSVCASSLLLIPSTWLSSILFLAYLLALSMTTMAHRDLYSDIWRRSVYEVAWFGRSHEVSSLKGNIAGRLSVDPSADRYEDIENSSARKQFYPVSDPVDNTSIRTSVGIISHENASVRNMSFENNSVENIALDNTSLENITVENIAVETASVVNTSFEDTSVGNISLLNISFENTYARNTSDENSVENSVVNIAVENTSVVNTSFDNTSVGNTSLEDNSVRIHSLEDTSVVNTFDNASVGNTSGENNSLEDTSVVNDSLSLRNTSVRQTSLGTISVKNAPYKATNSIRGIDPPFCRQPNSTRSNKSSPTISSIKLPSWPSKSAKSEVGSRFIETFHESTLLARSESLEHFIATYQVHKDPFPPSVIDVDAPIPLPRLSEWVKADALKGLSVHINPHTSVA